MDLSKTPLISLLFENGDWKIGSPNPFTHRAEMVNSGSVRFEKKREWELKKYSEATKR